MTIKVGDRLPDGKLSEATEFDEAAGCPINPKDISVAEAAKGKKIAIFAVQVGVYAPGTANIAIFFPFAASATLMSFGLIGQPAASSNSVASESLPSGSLSPTLMVISVSGSCGFWSG